MGGPAEAQRPPTIGNENVVMEEQDENVVMEEQDAHVEINNPHLQPLGPPP